jgi:sulfite exporter TauE/SafE/plastocyanin
MNLWAIFFTGLTTGGLSCAAVQGGLLASVIANRKERVEEAKAPDSPSALSENSLSQTLTKQQLRAAKKQQQVHAGQPASTVIKADSLLTSSFPVISASSDWLPVGLFLVSKFIAHILLGFLLGWVGSQLQLGLTVRLIFQGLAAAFMLATAFNLLEVHPIFRYVVFQPPRFVRKLVKNSTRGDALFMPALLGCMTIFIPCGVTQSMEVLAISSGSPVLGALILGTFVLGTSPVFALIGVATTKLSQNFHRTFVKVAAATLIVLAINSLNGILVVMDSPVTSASFTRPITYFFSEERFSAGPALPTGNTLPIQNGEQQMVIMVTNRGYSPEYVRVKAGQPVKLTLQTKDTYSCASAFRFKEFGVNFQLGPNDSKSVVFTPMKPGKYQYSCSMGMYTGIMEVL